MHEPTLRQRAWLPRGRKRGRVVVIAMSALCGNTNSMEVDHLSPAMPMREWSSDAVLQHILRYGPDEHLDVLGDLQLGVSVQDEGGGQLPSLLGVWTSGRAPERRRLTATAGNTMTESTPAPTSAAAFSGSIVPESRPILASATSSGRAVAVSSIIWTRPRIGQVAPIEQQGGEATDDEEQDEEDEQARRCLDDRAKVETHARRHEEDRDEEAVAHRVELGLQGVHIARRPAAQDHAGEEGAEHHVEPEIRGDHQQSEEQEHGPAKAWSARSRAHPR